MKKEFNGNSKKVEFKTVEMLPAEEAPLPSNGLVYEPSHVFHNRKHIEYKLMTPFNEDVLLNSVFVKRGVVVEKFISSCLLTPDVDLSNILIGDKNALMVSIFVSNYGKNYPIGATCPRCEEKTEINVDLSTVVIKRLDIQPVTKYSNKFKFVLPKSKHEIIFRFPTVFDEQCMDMHESSSNTKLVTNQLKQSLLEINGMTEKEYIENYINRMNAYDSLSLRNFIETNEPGLNMTTDFVCSSCDYTCGINIPTNHKFFPLAPEHREAVLLEPFFLLGYYFGMDWDTYYNRFPVNYKKWLIERIQKEIKESAKANEEGGAQTPSRGAHHNTPELRALSGKHRAQTPAKLRRFS